MSFEVVKITDFVETLILARRATLNKKLKESACTKKDSNVQKLLATIEISEKQTKNTSKCPDLRGPLKTADHCGAVLLFALNSLTYAFRSTSYYSFS